MWLRVSPYFVWGNCQWWRVVSSYDDDFRVTSNRACSRRLIGRRWMRWSTGCMRWILIASRRRLVPVRPGSRRCSASGCCCLGEFVAREGFDRWGMTPEAWLSWRCGMDRVTAREHLRVAESLRELPHTAQAFADGQTDFQQGPSHHPGRYHRPMSRTGSTPRSLVPASHLSRLVSQVRTATQPR